MRFWSYSSINIFTVIIIFFYIANITQSFHWLLKKCCFPYKECNPLMSYHDAILLDRLKREFCHLNMDKCGLIRRTVTVMKPQEKKMQFTILVVLKKEKFINEARIFSIVLFI